MSQIAPYNGMVSEYLAKGSKRSRENATRTMQSIIESMYRRVLLELNVNKFKWEGLPPEIDVRYMELTLSQRSLSVFFIDQDTGKYFALPAAPMGGLNILQQPIQYRVHGNANFRGRTLMGTGPDQNCVPIWANALHVPDFDIIDIYAQQLATIDTTIRINAKNARRSRILAVPKGQRNTYQNISTQIDEGESVIGVSNSFDPEAISALDLGVNPDSLEQLHILRVREWNSAMNLLGINNANQDKKERLVSDEVAANDEQVTAMKAVNLNARRRAAAEISGKYNLNVTVDYQTDPAPSVPSVMNPDEPNGDSDNGQLHAETK